MPKDMSLEVAQQIKEAHCYTCGDVVKVPRSTLSRLACHEQACCG